VIPALGQPPKNSYAHRKNDVTEYEQSELLSVPSSLRTTMPCSCQLAIVMDGWLAYILRSTCHGAYFWVNKGGGIHSTDGASLAQHGFIREYVPKLLVWYRPT
jgi:hypothetical protein